MKKILIGIIGLSLLSSCLYDKEEVTPIPQEPDPTVKDSTNNNVKHCDTLDVSFSNDVLPLINDKCSPCHTESNSGGHTWTNYDEVFADKNLILSAINHEPSTSNMPQGGDKLPESEIQLIQCWIDNGALNN